MPKRTKEERDAIKTFASMGGRANFAKHGSEHMAKIGRKGMEARWKKKKEKESSKEQRSVDE